MPTIDGVPVSPHTSLFSTIEGVITIYLALLQFVGQDVLSEN